MSDDEGSFGQQEDVYEEAEEAQEEDDGVDSEEAAELRGEKPSKRRKRSRFLDDEAADDEDAEDEEEEDPDEFRSFLADGDDDNASVPSRVPSRTRSVHSNQEQPVGRGGRSFLSQYQGDVHEIVEAIKRRAANQELAGSEDGYEGQQRKIQEACFPTLSDPKMFMVKIRAGTGRELCMKLMNKALLMAQAGTPLGIHSVVAVDHLRDYLYIEAYKADFVLAAIGGLSGVYRTKMQVVPIKEMVPIFRTSLGKGQPKPKQWARLRRAEYKGDLCQVVYFDVAQELVTVRVVPRIDIQSTVEQIPRPKGSRAPKKLFRSDEVTKYGGQVEWRDPNYYFNGMKFDAQGYLLREVKLPQLTWKDVIPTIEEIKSFTMGETISAKLLPTKKILLKLDDTVRITTGTEKGLKGKVVEIKDNMYIVRPNPEYGLNTLLSCTPDTLAKHFQEGEHVKCIQGMQTGLSGMIVGTDGDKCVIFSDVTHEQVTVFMNDVEPCTDISVSGESRAGRFHLGDLIKIDAHNAGVILRIEKDQFVVLNHDGMRRNVSIRDVHSHYFDKRVFVADSQGCAIVVGSPIKVTDGEFKGKYAVVEHMFRQVLFCRARDILENNGMFVVIGTMVVLLGGDKKKKEVMERKLPGPDASGNQTPGLFTKPPTFTPGMRAEGGKGKGKGKGGKGGKGKGPTNPNSWMERQHCVVTRGLYKGFRGRIIQATEEEVRVELHTNEKNITVLVSHVRIIDPKSADRVLPSGDRRMETMATPHTPSGTIGRTPVHTMATPLYAPDTPLYNFEDIAMRAPMTPGLESDDDVWKPDKDAADVPEWGVAMETANKEWESQAQAQSKPVGQTLPASHAAPAGPVLDGKTYWCLPGTMVKFIERVDDASSGVLKSHPKNTVAVITKVVGNAVDAVVYNEGTGIADSGDRVHVDDIAFLEPCQVSQKGQKCIVTGYKVIDSNEDVRTKYYGQTGEMLGESGEDQIIQLKGGMDIAVLKKVALARYVAPESLG